MIRTRAAIPLLLLSLWMPGVPALAETKPRIAVVSGPIATIQNSEPLVTSNKAREQYGLALLTNEDGSPLKHDHLAPQRIAAPVEVLIEKFSAHPLENDAADLYGPPDGYVDREGRFHEQRQSRDDKPVYKVTLKPEDGLYMLPYMARQEDGRPWEDDCRWPGAPGSQCRQPFFPDASRIFEEIDRGLAGISDGRASVLSSRADYDFYRAAPAGGYTRGLPASKRTDVGEGDVPPEVLGEDFFAYRPAHLRTSTRYQDAARAVNTVQQALNTGKYLGAIWLEGSSSVEETTYWLNLLVDTTVPIVGNASQRTNRALSADGPRNLVDSVDYIISKKWAGSDGKNELGAVVIQDEQIFAARQVAKVDARPGGYTATGDHGGILGTMGVPGPVHIYFKPQSRHTWQSEVKLTKLPKVVKGVRMRDGRLITIEERIKDAQGFLRGEAIPKISMVKSGRYGQKSSVPNPDDHVEIMARIEKNLEENPLAGFIAEGIAPYGVLNRSIEKALEIATFSGMPTVYVGRGNVGGLATVKTFTYEEAIDGNNLTATKARLLLKACLMKFGSLPPAADPRNPTPAERETVRAVTAKYQQIFDTH